MRKWKNSDPLPPMAIEAFDDKGRRLPDYYADAYEEFVTGTDDDPPWPEILQKHLRAAIDVGAKPFKGQR